MTRVYLDGEVDNGRRKRENKPRSVSAIWEKASFEMANEELIALVFTAEGGIPLINLEYEFKDTYGLGKGFWDNFKLRLISISAS